MVYGVILVIDWTADDGEIGARISIELETLVALNPDLLPHGHVNQNIISTGLSRLSTVHKYSFCHNRDKLWLLTRNFVALSPIVTAENVE
uniref:Uncharacterized protein n=1 Tax=Timema genevievae TaxID=629358 RepID=A0A7R9K2P2_TIMGE|nr:unnamed protein product [Timema genevievae]